ncbi:MAG: hypothetical protein MUF06_15620 [Pirellulaceae bacterium]|nr:hypothetical protein [Pirellulaceae bacterium]
MSNPRFRTLRAWCVWPAILATAGTAWGGDHESIGRGKEIFEREFAAETLASGGDGLGPVYNHHSCAACHLLGGLGGAGPVDVNAVALTADLANRDRPPTRALLARVLRQAHAGFASDDDTITPTILLHRFSTNERYSAQYQKLGGETIPLTPTAEERAQLQERLSRQPRKDVPWKSPVILRHSQRNTTALFGAGEIDRIPAAALEALSDAQARAGEVSGRVPQVGLTKVGRFGWRGQTETLHDFVLGACSNELGLEVPGSPQPVNPQRPSYSPNGFDLSADECAALTEFVASLPRPQMRLPAQPERRAMAIDGKVLFEQIGCSQCHVESIGPVKGIYSDLLLHDLGPGLADPVPAAPGFFVHSQRPLPPGTPEPSQQQQPQQFPQGYYGGGSSLAGLLGLSNAVQFAVDPKTGVRSEFRVLRTAVEQEWRTPPLWGVADSAPYLHDGRAATLIDAIVLHGGEADPCIQRFLELPLTERFAVVEFLNSLRAPEGL